MSDIYSLHLHYCTKADLGKIQIDTVQYNVDRYVMSGGVQINPFHSRYELIIPKRGHGMVIELISCSSIDNKLSVWVSISISIHFKCLIYKTICSILISELCFMARISMIYISIDSGKLF